ncbi:uncharacterized protein TNCT_654861 [Trichonephila clavata]|uniref:Uncharacterized protein n=1 Tax=Trichonephila clavata TaxID=2740835 RepID=A0A8X6LJV3_TRICU|nr:uncharacterized protein TNCT_654861 [Trichonephila clavata]
MSTEPSENDCSDKTPVLRNDFLMTSVQTTGEDWAIAGPSNASPRSSLESEPAFCPVHSPYAWSASSTRGESSTTSFNSAETALVTDSKSSSDESNRRVAIVDDPQNLPPTNELSAPPAYEDVFNGFGPQMSPTEECAEAYCEFAKIIRNSLYYNIFFDVLLLTVSISALFLGMLFINECTRHFELIFMVLLMGVNGLLCSLSRMAPLVFSKLGMVGSKWIFKTCAVIFLTLFALIGFVVIGRIYCWN